MMSLISRRSLSRAGLGLAAASCVGISASVALEKSGPVINEAAPAFTGIASNGEEVSLEQFAGKTVVLEWTNDGCPFVKKHYNSGNMQATQEVAANNDDIVWISIISSAPGKQGHVSADGANELTTSRGAKPDYVVLDEGGVIGRSYAAKTTPHMFVIDDQGVLQYDGAIDDNPSASLASIEGATNYTLAAMSAVLAGETPDPSKTKPYGCSVKYKS